MMRTVNVRFQSKYMEQKTGRRGYGLINLRNSIMGKDAHCILPDEVNTRWRLVPYPKQTAG